LRKNTLLRWALVVTILALAGPVALARINPLQQMTVPGVKPEVLILIDTSLSMRQDAAGSASYPGSDCSGGDANIDLPDDFMCSGHEQSINANDCTIAGNNTTTAGMPNVCLNASVPMSRLFFVKRAVQNVLSDFGGRASFGLGIFNDTGGTDQYFRYFKATGLSTATVAIFLTRLELASAGSWTGGLGWNPGTPGNPQSFKGPDGITNYTLLANNNSLFRRTNAGAFVYKRLNWAGSLVYDDGTNKWDYIGSYVSYAQKSNTGTEYNTWKFIKADGTISTTYSDGVYKGPQFVVGGTTTYVHYRATDDEGPTSSNGALQLVSLLADDSSKVLADFEAKTAKILNFMNTGFNGGILANDGGTKLCAMMRMGTQIYKHRLDGPDVVGGPCSDETYYSTTSSPTSYSLGKKDIYPGKVCPFTVKDDSAPCRKRYVLLMTDTTDISVDCNLGDTPALAKNTYCLGCKYSDGSSGTANCIANGANPATNCNKVMSNPIQTITVGIATTTTELKDIADFGYDGTKTPAGCTKAYDVACTADAQCCSGYCAPSPIGKCRHKNLYLTSTEAELTKAISETIAGAINGDFVTSSAAIASSGTTAGDYAVVPSTEYPAWKGHLRAYDLTQATPPLVWDAATTGALDPANSAYGRKIYTGYPRPAGAYATGGALVEVLVAGSLTNGAAIKAIATAAGSTVVGGLADGAGGPLEQFLQWVYGNGRVHRLPPIIRSMPATIGPPPIKTLKDHSTFEASNSARETLIYVASNEGLIHAFRNGKVSDGGGSEVFAFIPPNLLDALYSIYPGGQPSSLASFKWILSSSPRVDDVYDGTSWSTQLVVPMGPYSYGFAVLDVTNPTNCASKPCTLVPANLKIVALAHGTSTATLANATSTTSITLGEGWSLPALYWTLSGNVATNRASMGNGYGAATSSDKFTSATAGHYYDYFGTLWSAPTLSAAAVHAPPAAATAKVDYAVLPDSAAAMNWAAANPKVIAVYQADLDGRIVRYNEGTVGNPPVSNPVTLVAANPINPYYYSPAVLHIGGTTTNQVVIAAATGSSDEAAPPAPDIVTNLSMFSETDGVKDAAATYTFSCPIGSLKTCAAIDNTAIQSATLPTAAAKPVQSPLLLWNNPGIGTERVEAFYLVYETSTGSATCNTGAGTSYLIRVSINSTTGVKKAESVTALSGRAGGMSLAGGGSRVVLSMSAVGSGAASVTNTGAPIVSSATFGTPQIEVWREVR
jgi:hypothetical protein